MKIYNNLNNLYSLLKPQRTVFDPFGGMRNTLGGMRNTLVRGNYDTAEISVDARNKQIEAVIKSGEPLRGVSFEEFKNFVRSGPEAEMYKMYTLVKRGTKDIVNNREFDALNGISCNLTSLIQGIIYSDAYQEEAAKLRERYINNEKLTPEEKSMMASANHVAFAEAEQKRIANIMTKSFKKNLAEHGLSESEMEGVKFSLSGYRYTVSGIADMEKCREVEAALNSRKSSDIFFDMNVHSMLASTTKTRPPGYVLSEMLSRTEEFLRDIGQGEVKLTDLSIDKNGVIYGLTPTLERYFDGVDLGDDMNVWKGPDDPVQYTLMLTKRNYKWFLSSVIKEMQKVGYENLPRVSLDFTMKNGQLQFTYGNVKLTSR